MKGSFLLKVTSVATLSFAAVMATSTTAEAQTGSRLNFTGSAQVRDQPGSMGANLLIDFLAGSPEPTIAGTPTGTVTATQSITGVFAAPGGIVPGTQGTIMDLVSTSSNFTPLPMANFLTMGGYTFSLTSTPPGSTFGPITLSPLGEGTLASFGVRGIVTGPGLGGMQYNYTGIFSAQFANQTPAQVFNSINTGSTLPVSFSAEFAVGTVVPEPSTYALMGLGLAALGLVARRRRLNA